MANATRPATPAQETAPKLTEFVVQASDEPLAQFPPDHPDRTFQVIGTYNAPNSSAARKMALNDPENEGWLKKVTDGTEPPVLATVPQRSWDPRPAGLKSKDPELSV